MAKALTALLALSSAALVPAVAQTPDTLPFRAHQWAFLFAGGSSFNGIGFLHFTAPNRAWVVNLGVSASHSNSDLPYATDTTQTVVQNQLGLTLSLGRRLYEPVRPGVVAYQTFSIQGSLSHESGSTTMAGVGTSGSGTGWSAGAGFDLGAQYLLTSRLSIGGQIGVSLVYGHQRSGGAFELTERNWQVTFSLGQVGFGGAIYF